MERHALVSALCCCISRPYTTICLGQRRARIEISCLPHDVCGTGRAPTVSGSCLITRGKPLDLLVIAAGPRSTLGRRYTLPPCLITPGPSCPQPLCPHAAGDLLILTSFPAAGYDRHGQDATAAAVQAVQRATENVTMPGVVNFVPDGFDGLKVKVSPTYRACSRTS